MVKVRISSFSTLTMAILSPGDLLDKLDAPTELLLLQARGIAGSCKDAEDIVTLKVPHHVAAFSRPDMASFHYQLEIHPLPRLSFFDTSILDED